MDNPIKPIVLEKHLRAPWGFLLGTIILLCGAAYLQASGSWSGMSHLHWGATVLICAAVFLRPVLNGGRTVRFKIDESGIHFDPFTDVDSVSIDWSNIERIRLHRDDDWMISIQLKSEAKKARFWIRSDILITEDYGLPLDKMFHLLSTSHDKYKS